VVIIESGHVLGFFSALFRLFRIRVVFILHNTLWPKGFPPITLARRVNTWLDALCYRHVATSIICVSPECERQVRHVTHTDKISLVPVRAQFHREYFQQIPAPPPFSRRQFQVMFIGRVNRDKGVFDILEMAKQLEADIPGRVQWEICGKGPDLEGLRLACRAMDLEEVVTIRGWTSLSDLRDVYARSHAAIVPTRSGFAEGLAMTAVEAVLAGRPFVSNPVVPATELLSAACLIAETNDAASHAKAVRALATDRELYDRLRASCGALAVEFYDRSRGLAQALAIAIEQSPGARS
jgi:glycosyltransferase involved in cell wall biosynthesis